MVAIPTCSNLTGDSITQHLDPSFRNSILRSGFGRSGIWRTIAHQALHCKDFTVPLLGRFREKTAPATVWGDIVLDPAHGSDLRAVTDVKVVVDPDLGAQRHVVADRQAARQADLRRQQTTPADRHVVPDLNLIVDFCPFSDNGVTQAAAVDGRTRADFDVVLDQHTSGLRDLHMTFEPKKMKP